MTLSEAKTIVHAFYNKQNPSDDEFFIYTEGRFWYPIWKPVVSFSRGLLQKRHCPWEKLTAIADELYRFEVK